MELTFEYSQKVADGQNPAAYHTPDNQLQVLYTDAGVIKATYTDTPMGEFDDRQFVDAFTASDDDNVQHLRVTYLPRMNVFWSWESNNLHRLALMILKQDGSPYLDNGTISFNDADAVASLSLSLTNPDGIFAAENWAGVTPGTRINVFYQMGDSARIQIGMFYVDKIDHEVGSATVPIEARNIVGKLLKDQTLDEHYFHLDWSTEDFFGTLLESAGIENYSIQPALYPSVYKWTRDKTYFDAILEAMQPLPYWKMRENPDGEIVIGNSETYDQFTEGVFQFTRGADVFSRKVLRDDQHAYSRVCVWFTERWIEEVGELPITGENIGTGDGVENEFYTERTPIKNVQAVRVDGTPVDLGDLTIHQHAGRIRFDVAVPAVDEEVEIDYIANYKKAELESLGEYDGITPLSAQIIGRPIADEYEVWCKYADGGIMVNLSNLEPLPSPFEWYSLNQTTGEFSAEYAVGEYFVSYKTTATQTVENTEDKYYYADVDFRANWNMPRKKTAYIELPENTDEAHALDVLDELATRYENAGVIETFVGRFTPHLQPGDIAEIDTNQVGIVTHVQHSFGKGGFYTEFTVDAAGLQGKPRITDYIEKVVAEKTKLKGLYRELE